MKPFHRPKRATHSRALEIKTVSADGRFAGYASVFGNVDSQRDVVRKGAFLRSLRARTEPLQLLWQHQWNEPIGIIEKIFEDARGLYVEGRLLMEVARAKEALALMKSGIVKGLSIGYTVKSFRRNPDTGVRELLEIELFEVSLVTAPANHTAKVTVVKARDTKATERAALEQAIGRALPLALSVKSAAVRQQTLKVLGDAAYYHFRQQLQEFERALREQAKAGYNPNQPRVPAGNPDGGQWASGSGGSGNTPRTVSIVTPLANTTEVLGASVDSSWARPETFEKHYHDHRKQFGSISRAQYSSMAQEFYKEAQAKKYPAVTTKEGYTKIYDPKTNRFGVYNPRGQTESFYKARGRNYFKNVIRGEIPKGGRLINARISSSAGGIRGGGGIGGGITDPQDLIDMTRDFDIIY